MCPICVPSPLQISNPLRREISVLCAVQVADVAAAGRDVTAAGSLSSSASFSSRKLFSGERATAAGGWTEVVLVCESLPPSSFLANVLSECINQFSPSFCHYRPVGPEDTGGKPLVPLRDEDDH